MQGKNFRLKNMASPQIQPKLVIHGGAGSSLHSKGGVEAVRKSLYDVLEEVYPLLKDGASAVNAVVRGCQLLEDDPRFNAGTGSVVQSDGQIRMSASLMDGFEQRFSGAINVSRVQNPIELAKFLQRSDDRVLSDYGSAELLRELQLPIYDPMTDLRLHEWIEERKGNFNKAMATAADLVIAEVEEIVPVGEIAPEFIHTQGCFVDYLVEAKITLEDLGSSASVSSSKKVDESRMNMARRALQELQKGDVVNLGIGIPTLVADLITEEHGIILHTENGMLGVGPVPTDGGGAMDYPVNAGKIPVTALKGSSYFDSADSFAMIRGKHIDVAIMGGLECDESANLANWAVPNKPLLGVGGAMDLAKGAKRLIITMTHTNPDGSAKIVPSCVLPLTAAGVVDMVITDLAVFAYPDGKLTLIELMPNATLEEVRAKTSAVFEEKLS